MVVYVLIPVFCFKSRLKTFSVSSLHCERSLRLSMRSLVDTSIHHHFMYR